MPKQKWKATKAELKETDHGPWYQITHQKEDGTFHAHLMPLEAFEWRAAEYDLDPEDDFDTIMDILIHEPFIPDPNDPGNFEEDAAARVGLLSDPIGKVRRVSSGPVPTTLFNAVTVEDAKAATLERVKQCKSNRCEVDTTSVKEQMRGSFHKFLDREEVEKKRRVVERTRSSLKAKKKEARGVVRGKTVLDKDKR